MANPTKKSASLYNDATEQTHYAELEQIATMLEAQRVLLEQTDAAKLVKSVVPRKYKALYAAAGHPGTCGDALSVELAARVTTPSGINLAALYAIAACNGIDAGKRWGHLNVGMQRMNLSNVLRQAAAKGRKTLWPS